MTKLHLQAPAQYTPFADGHYTVQAGLRRFGTDFGNGVADQQVFQFDRQFPRYRKTKLDARQEIHRHVLIGRYSRPAAKAISRFLVWRLGREHPRLFAVEAHRHDVVLECLLTQERLTFDKDYELADVESATRIAPAYESSLDALACQLQEDLVVTCAADGENWIAALHVCLPSHWSPRQKLGLSFSQVHAPVPHSEKMNERGQDYALQMVAATDGLVRFVWGVQKTDRLNMHSELGQVATADVSTAFVRVERQTIWGLPKEGAALFAIRPYLVAAKEIRRDRRRGAALVVALRSMSNQSRVYKGLSGWHEQLVQWLEAGR